MPAKPEKSSLKRAPPTADEETELKKPRRSQRLSDANGPKTTTANQQQLPSPVTHKDSTATEDIKEDTVSPSLDRPSQRAGIPPHFPSSPNVAGLSSPPSDTQPYSQFVYPPQAQIYGVEDEEAEGVWGYLVPIDSKSGDAMVLKRRSACPVPTNMLGAASGKQRVGRKTYQEQEWEYEKQKQLNGVSAGGYLIGRHPECDRIINSPVVSNRHCLIFNENKFGDTIAVLEDLSGNGTFVNDSLVGRNKRRELCDGDSISIVDEARFVFHYPHSRNSNGFRQQYSIQEQLGKGHFASVYLCIERATGLRYAVKKFEKRAGPGERSKVDGLQQEIAVLMGVSHPGLLCLKDTFDEDDGVYLVLELAPEGELFNWIVTKQKLTECETRKVFVQLFQAIKYLHERNIVHRDIKPENILLIDKELTVKVADFGLAKIIGEESFTTTLCGTPSYVAPEILEPTNHRRYTRAVDVWSLGVVLYICLCGFPPFSDELYTPSNPYTLSQQIKMGRFDYPSPYWDSVGDAALDLIDRMLTVDVERRITIEECLEHPWITNRPEELPAYAAKMGGYGGAVAATDSTDGLVGRLGELDFEKRKVRRERTLLSQLNEVRVARVVEVDGTGDGRVGGRGRGGGGGPGGNGEGQGEDGTHLAANGNQMKTATAPVKVWEKNPKVSKKAQNGEMEMKKQMLKEADPAAARNPNEFMGMGGKGDVLLFGDEGSVYSARTVKAKPVEGGGKEVDGEGGR
ncbi:serine/threonine protein kinase [Coniosporium apollinis]|uniref:Serine/threonine protein kinase n=1 Tax=Coniosporium apollinis TaxID=61459 RepID=A0ABQ9NNN7_9PEZI|nr:serine/threonine protein kinase [Coniosporium apollinis]